ncbi:MAG: polysaccharide biosynthesis/export family protein [Thermoanaerobaculia bacterium]|jgi:protein involved in polysaccharide export with SLBB domain|nr:polysaccharide biosynthesis/export family protein [Thermoanaerobaculia bacterium]
MRAETFALLLASAVLGTGSLGCTSAGATAQQADSVASARPAAAEPAAPPPEYRLQAGDVLEIKHFYTPELNETVSIRPDGRISLPIAGEVLAEGQTPAGLRDVLSERYARTLREQEVAVVVKEFAGRRIYVGGEVLTPGVIRPPGTVTALQAILEAGGAKSSARLENVVILRNQGTTEPLFMTLDLRGGLERGASRNDVALLPSDIVFVPKTRVAHLAQFVDVYFKQLLPIPLNLSYILGGWAP